jgi:hypothetical protein
MRWRREDASGGRSLAKTWHVAWPKTRCLFYDDVGALPPKAILLSLPLGELMTFKYVLVAAALVGLSACDSALEATKNSTDFNIAYATYGNLLGSPFSSAPSGGGTYNGEVTSNAFINGKGGYRIVGDMDMTIDFGQAGSNLSGAITDINLLDDVYSVATQQMTNGNGANGSLSIAGSRSGSSISANATGRLGAVLADEDGDSSMLETRADINWRMVGNVRTTTKVSDTVLGTFSGSGTQTSVNGMTVSTSGGEFYGRN